MKSGLLSLIAVTIVNVASMGEACTISPKGDSHLRMNALHDSLGDMEALKELVSKKDGTYEISVIDYITGKTAERTYRLENTSPMCPEYVAIEVK